MTDALKAIAIRLAILTALFALVAIAGCHDLYQSQTTVIGVEVAYDPTQSVIPSARAGVITHRQQAAARNAVKSMSNAIDYYQLNVWAATGNVKGEMTLKSTPQVPTDNRPE